MKNTMLLAFCLILCSITSAYGQDKMEAMKNMEMDTTKKMGSMMSKKRSMMKDCVMMKDGKMMMKEGDMMDMNGNMKVEKKTKMMKSTMKADTTK